MGNSQSALEKKNERNTPVEGTAPEKNNIEKEPSFAEGLNFYKLFWIFFIGCIIGVVVETLWCVATLHRIESRQGLVYGPFNPVYGVGAILMTLALNWLARKSDFLIFLGSAVIGGLFEALCSVFQEYIFHTVSWDYNDRFGILGGRTSLLYMVFWGVLGLMWIKEIFPRLSRMIEKIPNKIGRRLTIALTVFMVFNIIVSSAAALRMEERKVDAVPSNDLERLLDERFPDERMHKIYPNLIPMSPKEGETPG